MYPKVLVFFFSLVPSESASVFRLMSLALASGVAVGDGASVEVGAGAGSLVGAGGSSIFLAQATRSRAIRAKASRKNLTGFVFLKVGIFRSSTSLVCLSMLHQGIAP